MAVSFWPTLPKPIMALAPMAGVCDSPFRRICKQHGADVIYTEFLSADALVHGNVKTREMLKFDISEKPIVCQIFGKNPATVAQAAKIVEDEGYDGVDLNFGCPAYKVVKVGGGVSLMRDLNKVYDVIGAVIEAVNIPLSIKIRARIKAGAIIRDLIENKDAEDERLEREGEVTAHALVKKISDLPISAIMLHSRSFEQPFDGVPDLAMVKAVRQIYSGILLANGGVYSPEEAKRQLDETGADGVGLARGVHGNPWLFQQIKDYLKVGKYEKPSYDNIKKTMLEHAQLALQIKGEQSIIELRKHLAWYIKAMPGAKDLRSKLVQVKTLKDIESILHL